MVYALPPEGVTIRLMEPMLGAKLIEQPLAGRVLRVNQGPERVGYKPQYDGRKPVPTSCFKPELVHSTAPHGENFSNSIQAQNLMLRTS